MKNKNLILFCLFMPWVSYAAISTPTEPFDVVVPNLCPGIEVLLEGQLTRPTYNTTALTDFARINSVLPSFPPSVNVNTNTSSNGMSYDTAFRVGVGYIFADSGNDVIAHWTHLDTNHQNSDAIQGIAQTLFPAYFTNIVYTFATSDISTRYDAVDLDFGQFLDLGTNLETRSFAGLRAAEIKTNITNFYINPEFIQFNQVTATDTFYSKYTGIGPRFGVSSVYHLWDGLGIVAEGASALLIGTQKNHSQDSFTTQTGGIPPAGSFVLTHDNLTKIVPVLDGRLGLDYSWIYDEAAFTVAGGYQISYYFGAQETAVNPTLFATTANEPVRATNVGFDGPYVSIGVRI